MMEVDYSLLKQAKQEIESLRETLAECELAYPHLFYPACGTIGTTTRDHIRYSPPINMYWDVWSTDEILETISDEISHALNNMLKQSTHSENVSKKEENFDR